MDTKKLSKIVKAIVSAEVKRQLPVLVEKEVQKKTKPLLREIKRLKEQKVQPTATKKEAESDMFSLADQILTESRNEGTSEGINGGTKLSMMDEVENEKHLSKNPMIDKILKETKPFSAAQRTAGPVGFEANLPKAQPINEASGDGYEEYPTMNHNLKPTPGSTPVPPDVKAQMAAKMGYGDMSTGPSKQGLGVTTGLPALDRVLNRDNSELVKRFKR